MLAWHYTTERKFQHIIASGMLIPGGIGGESTGTPVLWFSRNQHWEQTAGDECHEAGQPLRCLTMRETHVANGGLVRFGGDAKRLYVGEVLRRKAQMTHPVWAALPWSQRDSLGFHQNSRGRVCRRGPSTSSLHPGELYGGCVLESGRQRVMRQ
jgi:hypothetical protein